MSVKIRLKRMGMKKKPFYRVVVADVRSPRDGRFIEEIGYYDPMTKPAEIKVNNDRAQYWLGVGAQPTDTVRILLKKSGAIEEKYFPKEERMPLMQELLTFVARSLVEHPDQVSVTETEGPEAIILELHVAEDDMGKVIGKQGRIAKAIRAVVKAATAKNSKPVFVEIQE